MREDEIMSTQFPPEFVWGAATASYQIEGAATEDGRGESIWDRFCATPGRVANGDTGAIACDFYHRYRDDAKLMRDLGLDAFRFSVAWPRVVPDGRGRVNERGLDFYDRLLDELLAAGIQPFVTLYHWDLPQALEDAGGWPEPSTAEAFAEYAEAVAKRLGDRVEWWTTHNEPWVSAWLGYGYGLHAPGRASEADAFAATQTMLESHALAVDVLRRESPGSQVGIVLNLDLTVPASADPADVEAARLYDGVLNRWFLDPLYRGEYPADVVERFGVPVRDLDLPPIDFLGINNYTRALVQAGPDGLPLRLSESGVERTAMDWAVRPDSLRDLLVRVHEEYAPPAIFVTENGAAYDDVRRHDGSVLDPERVSYLAQHTTAVARAIGEGVPVKGYFVWSFLDNFEWAHGYSKRFGIVYVDYPTLERVPKASFEWYRTLIASHAARGTEVSAALR